MTKDSDIHNPANEALIFDRQLIRARRERAARRFSAHSFLVEEVADRLIERLEEINRKFRRILILGDAGGALFRRISKLYTPEIIVRADHASAMLAGAGAKVAVSEEYIPFAAQSFDLVISNLTLHWVNDVPGALIQINRVLKPDGLFLAAKFGGATLHELREALAQAEVATTGGLSPRVSPFADIRDGGGLLQRAGFALPVADCDTINVTYADAFALMRELRGMGETNAVLARRKNVSRRDTLLAAAENYARRYARADGRIPATFQILYFTGWAPDAAQPKALKPGSAKARLADALKVAENKF